MTARLVPTLTECISGKFQRLVYGLRKSVFSITGKILNTKTKRIGSWIRNFPPNSRQEFYEKTDTIQSCGKTARINLERLLYGPIHGGRKDSQKAPCFEGLWIISTSSINLVLVAILAIYRPSQSDITYPQYPMLYS